MTINRIYIKSFGNLREFELVPISGINVITGANESGKSTLAAFIKFMFYGFTSKRSKDNTPSPADRYINWETHTASGSLELTANDGSRYRIEREFYRVGKKNTGNVTVINLQNGEIAEKSPEELFLGGVFEDVFNRTVFISQTQGSSIDSEAVYTSVENMLTGADEEVSVKKALSRLDSARITLLYKNEKGGKIHLLRKTIDDLNEKKLALSQQNERIRSLKSEIEEDSNTLSQYKNQILEADCLISSYENADRLERINSTILSKKAIEELEIERDLHIKNNTKNGFFPNKDYLSRLNTLIDNYYLTLDEHRKLNLQKDSLQQEYQDECKKAQGSETSVQSIVKSVSAEDAKRVKLKKLSIYSLIAIGFFTLFFVISLMAIPLLRLPLGALSAVFLAFFIAFRFLMKSCENTIRLLLSQVGAKSPEELRDLCSLWERNAKKRDLLAGKIGDQEELIRQCNDKISKTLKDFSLLSEKFQSLCSDISQCEAFRKNISNIIDRLDELDTSLARKKEEFRLNSESFTDEEYNSLKAMEKPSLPLGATIRSALIEAKGKKRHLEDEEKALSSSITDKRIKLASLIADFEDEDSIQKKITSLNEQLNKLILVYNALRLASDSLEKASAASRDRVAPRLSELSSEIISHATDGKYEKINVDSKLKLSYTHEEATRDIAYLSEGTKDIVYIAFRISLISMLFKDCPPILIDEGFAGMDDERLTNTLRAVSRHVKKQKAQVFIFSPTKREANKALPLGAYVYTMDQHG